MSSHVPEVLMKKVDEYVDSLAPQIQPRITSELEEFQQKTIDTLETQVVDAFRSLFDKDKGGSRSLDDAAPDSYGGQSLPFADEIAKLTRNFSKISDEAGDDLREIFDLTEDQGGPGATQSRGLDRSNSSGAKEFLSAAINAVQDHLDDNSNRGSSGQKLQLDGLLGVISNTVKDASRNPEDSARLISPEIKEAIGGKLRDQHATIAEQFTKIALDHIKRWLRGNTSNRDLGDGVKGEIEDQVKDLVKGFGGLFGSKKSSHEGSSRGLNDGDRDRDRDDTESSGGFSKVISDKLSTGLAKVHREVRLEFRKILGAIEKELFELIPDKLQRPLEKILGGNPFDEQLDREAHGGQADRGFGDDIKAKLVSKIRGLVRKVQEMLRESILGVVNGGHRKFERASWVFVQAMVEQKVQKYLPKVKITVPDDIGNEGVSVGSPTAASQQQGGHQSGPSSQTSYPPPPSHDQHNGQPQNQQGYGSHGDNGNHSGYSSQNTSQNTYPPPPSHEQYGGQGNSQQGYNAPSQYQHQQGHSQQGSSYPSQYQQQQDHRPDYNQQPHEYRPQHQGSSEGYPPNQYQTSQHQPQSHQEYRPDQYQQHQQYNPQDYQSDQRRGYQ